MLSRLNLNARRALDVGCADGAFVNALLSEGVDAYGIDVSLEAINSSPIKNRLKWVDIDGERLPFPDEHFDLVVSIEVFEHLHSPAHAMGEVARVLKPGGFFFFTTPSPSRPKIKIFSRLFPPEPTHVSELPRDAWIKMLKEHGLKPVRIPAFQLLKLRSRLVPLDALLHNPAMGPKARRLKLHKAGVLGKIIKFVWDVLILSYLCFSGKQMMLLAKKP